MCTNLHVTFWCQKLAVRIVLDSSAVMIVKYMTAGVRSGMDRTGVIKYWNEDLFYSAI
jgi:hypothetical protein